MKLCTRLRQFRGDASSGRGSIASSSTRAGTAWRGSASAAPSRCRSRTTANGDGGDGDPARLALLGDLRRDVADALSQALARPAHRRRPQGFIRALVRGDRARGADAGGHGEVLRPPRAQPPPCAARRAGRGVKTTPLGRQEIEEILPHRDPFLLLDEVVELEPGVRVVARKQVRDDEWYLAGHFPGPADHARRSHRRGDGADGRRRRPRRRGEPRQARALRGHRRRAVQADRGPGRRARADVRARAGAGPGRARKATRHGGR